MKSIITAPISLLVSLSILSGWFINDFQAGVAVEAVQANSINSAGYEINKVELMPNTSSPDIPTNWFSGTSTMSVKLPSAQARNDDKDKYITKGRILGDSFGSDGHK